MNNFIRDTNPFNLSAPPKWWLQRLWEFDNSLVIIPSRMEFHYRLCQRRPTDAKAKLVNELKLDSDSGMLLSHGLIPVTTILANPKWDNPLMWEDLKSRAPWRMGGAEVYEKLLDGIDAKREMDIALRADDRNTQLAKDAWRMYNKKIGHRAQMYSPTVKSKIDKGRIKSPQIIIPAGFTS